LGRKTRRHMIPLKIVSFHEAKCLPWVEAALTYYAEKMKYWVDLERIALKPMGGKDRRTATHGDWKKYHEHRAFENTNLIILDEKGHDLRSLQWGAKVPQWLEKRGGAAFLIGPTYGLDLQWKEQAQGCLKLSSLTLTHELALVVLFEQLYRSLTIAHNLSYHCE